MGNNKFSIASVGNRRAFRDGARDGVPIALGYFAVSFSLGIVARNVGMTPIQGMITSALCNASAGEYAGFTMIAAGAAYIEMAIVTLIANARYLTDELCHESENGSGYAVFPQASHGF